jgi:hypothetical protein
MTVSDETAEADRRKAKHLAMVHALQMIERNENEMCSRCAEWKGKWTQDCRQYCQEISYLRETVQKMIDTLAGYVSSSSLHELAESLQLDQRIFIVHGSNKCYAPPDGAAAKADVRMELKAKDRELEQVTAERDLAKMQLFRVGKELAELKEGSQGLDRELAEREQEARQRKRRLEKVESRVQILETQSSCAGLLLDPGKLKPQNLKSMDASMPQQGARLTTSLPGGTELGASQKTRRKIDAEHHNGKLAKGNGSTRESMSSSRAAPDMEQQRLDTLEERLGMLEHHGFVGRAPLAEVLASRPCKPPVRIRPKELEVNLKDGVVPKGRRSRSLAGCDDGSLVTPASPALCSARLGEHDRSILSKGPSSQFISFSDHELHHAEVAAYLSRSHLGEQRPPSHAGVVV